MAETVEGGVYKVGDEWQDANGNKVDAPKVEKEEAEETGEAPPAPVEEEPKRGPGRPRGS